MNAIVVINPVGQDEVLGNVFDDEMKKRNWSQVKTVPDMYVKKFDASLKEDAIKKSVDADVDGACFQAEWDKLDYAVIITSSTYSIGQTK